METKKRKKCKLKKPSAKIVIFIMGILTLIFSIAAFVIVYNKCAEGFWLPFWVYIERLSFALALPLVIFCIIKYLYDITGGDETMNKLNEIENELFREKYSITYTNQEEFNKEWLNKYQFASKKIYIMGYYLIGTIKDFEKGLNNIEIKENIRNLDIRILISKNKKADDTEKKLKELIVKKMPIKFYRIKEQDIKNQICIIDNDLTVIPYSITEEDYRPIYYIRGGKDNFLFTGYLSEFKRNWENAEKDDYTNKENAS